MSERSVLDMLGIAPSLDTLPPTNRSGVGPLDLIYGLVNALGGSADPRDAAALAWAREHEAVLAFIAECGGRDPHEIDPDWALTDAAHRRGQAVTADLYPQTDRSAA